MAKDIYVNRPSSIIRICFQIYFTVSFLLVSIISNSCCVLWARLQLARHNKIQVVKLTGWLDWANVILLNWHCRANVLGSLGIIMIFTSLLSKASNLAVTGLVNNVTIITRCDFNTNTDFLVLAPEYYGVNFGAPDPQGSFYNLVTQAQVNSIRNGGADGIYNKVNTDVQFRADANDVYANWKCNGLGDPSQAPTYDANQNYSAIVADLWHKNLVFADQNNNNY